MLAILALAVGLRAYRIGEESVWWDEYTSLVHLDADSIWRFLNLNRTLDPATMPLYYSLEYLWWHYVSGTVTGLRWLSVLIGLAALPLLYGLGRRLFGPSGGAVAALLYALSPIHVFHAQGIRMYVLLVTLAIASACTFAGLVEDGRLRWWVAHGAANALLFWTHPFAFLLPAAQGIFLLLFRRRQWDTVGAWGVLQAGLLLPPAMYLSEARFWPTEQTADWMKLPSVGEFLGDLLADDAIGLTYQLRISDRAPEWLVSRQPLFVAALILLPFMGAVGIAWRARHLKPLESRITRERLVFLLTWLLLPAMALYAASLLWRPCIFPRYTAHSSLALYLMVGGAAAMSGRAVRIPGIVAVAVLYATQLALTIPGPQRTDWRSAAAHVREQAAPDDLILVRGSSWREVFAYVSGPMPNPMASAETAEALADQAALFLQLCREEGTTGESSESHPVWAVLATPYFDSGPDRDFELQLAAHGLAFSMHEFGGMEHVLTYRITRPSPGRQEPGFSPAASPSTSSMKYAVAQDFGDLALALGESGNHACALHVTDYIARMDPSWSRSYFNFIAALERGENVPAAAAAVRTLWKGYGLLQNRRYDQAIETFQRAVVHDPLWKDAWHALVTACIEAGEYDSALPGMQMLTQLDPSTVMLFGRLMAVISRGEDAGKSLASLEAVLDGIHAQDMGRVEDAQALFHKAIAADPGFGTAHCLLGLLHLSEGDQTAFLDAMQQAYQADPEIIGRWKPLIEALFVQQDPAAARAAALALRKEGVFVIPDLLDLVDSPWPAGDFTAPPSDPPSNTDPSDGS